MLNAGELKKLLEGVDDDVKVVVQIQGTPLVGSVTGVWGPTQTRPMFVLVARPPKKVNPSQKTQPL